MASKGANSLVLHGNWATDGIIHAESVSNEFRAKMEAEAEVTYENGVKVTRYLPAPVGVSKEAWKHTTIQPVRRFHRTENERSEGKI